MKIRNDLLNAIMLLEENNLPCFERFKTIWTEEEPEKNNLFLYLMYLKELFKHFKKNKRKNNFKGSFIDYLEQLDNLTKDAIKNNPEGL